MKTRLVARSDQRYRESLRSTMTNTAAVMKKRMMQLKTNENRSVSLSVVMKIEC